MQLHKVVEGRLTCWGICEQGDWWGLVTYPIAYGSKRKNRHALGTGVGCGGNTRPTVRVPAARSAVSAKMQRVTGSWVSVLTTLIPLALVVVDLAAVVIPAVLVLQTPRPRPTGLAFLGGWLLGLIALTAVFVASSDALSARCTTRRPPGCPGCASCSGWR
jgi:hypothetical protein